MRLILLTVTLLLLALLSACPRPAGDGTAPPASRLNTGPPENETGDVTPLHEATEPEILRQPVYRTENRTELVYSMLGFLNDHDHEKYLDCFHPDSPKLEEMLWVYDDFTGTNKQALFTDVGIEGTDDSHALARYKLVIRDPETGDSETEEGIFELLRLENGSWVIWDVMDPEEQ